MMTNATGIGMKEVSKELESQIQTAGTNVKAALVKLEKSGDSTDPTLLLGVQHAINTWTTVMNTSSSITKALKDACSGILQKI